jgi:hypothetical protein
MDKGRLSRFVAAKAAGLRRGSARLPILQKDVVIVLFQGINSRS